MGIEVDPFALELARLSLTLADIPYPNGWKLTNKSMFLSKTLETSARNATIFLANPPFQDFTNAERESISPRLLNKTAEMLWRALPSLGPGSVFGVIVPRGFLDVKGSAPIREVLARDFDLEEIALFPDKVFRFSGMECAVLLGRRLRRGKSPSGSVRCRWIRERGIEKFRRFYSADERSVLQSSLSQCDNYSLFVPQLGEVWEVLKHNPKLETIAEAGEGLSFKSSNTLLPGIRTYSKDRFPGAVKGFVRLGSKSKLDGLPPEIYMNLSPEAVAVRRSGAVSGIPQVLMNHARVARGPWRIKAFVDTKGHPCTNNFNVVRPVEASIPLAYIWALLNSPLANAFVYTHSWRRHNLPGVIEAIPIPSFAASAAEVTSIASIARDYIEFVQNPVMGLSAGIDDESESKRKQILLHLDSAILRLYSLPPRMERKLLDLFANYPRPGVPFGFTAYYPPDFRPCFPLHEYLSEEYQNSTAGALLNRPREPVPENVKAALKRAQHDFKE